MPPKVKITRDDIVNTAVEIVRMHGAQAINARTVAATMNCSTQPIFSNFESMDSLRLAVVEKADALCTEYMHREMTSEKYPPYKASGMAYIRFAQEEKELFKLLYMRDRSSEKLSEESAITNEIIEIVHNNTGLENDQSQLFHLEMWAYVHGIAVMLATGFFELDWELISKMLTDVYQGLRKQYAMED